jgi:putative chitinase
MILDILKGIFRKEILTEEAVKPVEVKPRALTAIDRKRFYDEYRKTFGSFKEDTLKTLEAILDVFEKNKPEPKVLEKYAYMLATVRHEVGPRMIPIVENMNYSAKRMMQVWPSRFPTLASAQPFANNPEKLGNNVYGNRLGNGPPSSGDGYRYRGRGIGAQFTGRVNYERFSKLFGVDFINNPDLALDVNLGAEILYKGSVEGLFTGVGLGRYINDKKTDFINARRVINADVARNGASIARDAERFLNILRKST